MLAAYGVTQDHNRAEATAYCSCNDMIDKHAIV